MSEGHFCVRLQLGAAPKAKDAVANTARMDVRTIVNYAGARGSTETKKMDDGDDGWSRAIDGGRAIKKK